MSNTKKQNEKMLALIAARQRATKQQRKVAQRARRATEIGLLVGHEEIEAALAERRQKKRVKR